MDHKLDLEAHWNLSDLDKDGYIDWDDLPDIAPYHRLPKPTKADDKRSQGSDGPMDRPRKKTSD